MSNRVKKAARFQDMEILSEQSCMYEKVREKSQVWYFFGFHSAAGFDNTGATEMDKLIVHTKETEISYKH